MRPHEAASGASRGRLDGLSSLTRLDARSPIEVMGASHEAPRAIIGATFGALPGPIQTSPRAELWAAIQALRYAILPLRLHTDHKPLG